MTNWYENIPKNGVLTRHRRFGAIHRVMQTVKHSSGATLAVWDSGGQVYVDDLIPLTAQELWAFMPWQDMENAPTNGTHMLLKECGGETSIGYHSGGLWNEKGFSDFGLSPIAWLPLPELTGE